MKKIVLALLLALGLAQSGFAAVAKSDSGTAVAATAFNSSSTTVSLTTLTVSAGSNLCLIGILHTNTTTNGDITGVTMTWNGASMTSVVSKTNNDIRGRTEIFRLVNPATGNNTLTASWTNGVDAVIGAIAFSGADQTTCVNAGDNVTGTALTDPTLTVTSTTDGATVVGFTSNTNFGTGGGSNPQTVISGYANNATWAASYGSYAIGGTSNIHDTAAGANPWAGVGVHIIAASAGGASTPRGSFFGMIP